LGLDNQLNGYLKQIILDFIFEIEEQQYLKNVYWTTRNKKMKIIIKIKKRITLKKKKNF
jgi:hypothetical protein